MSGLDDMALFAAVVRRGGFTAAARELDIPLSTVSRRVAQLEKRLGMQLLQRTTRSLKATEAGQLYYQHCQQLVDGAREAERALQRLQQEPSGHLRYATPFAVDDSWASSVISSFLEKYPKITLEGEVQFGAVDPDEAAVDVLLGYGARPETHHPVIGLGTMDVTLCASPAYLRRHGVPKSPEALLDHQMIHFTLLPWPEHAPPAFRSLLPEYRIATNEMLMARQVCLDGLGIAWLPAVSTHRHLAQGSLVQVLPEHSYPMPLWLIHRSRRKSSLKVALFVEHVSRMVEATAPWR